ncbi:hypothetical protein KUCAC02_031443, partial [Chaenocephalus aceratus]
ETKLVGAKCELLTSHCKPPQSGCSHWDGLQPQSTLKAWDNLHGCLLEATVDQSAAGTDTSGL